MSQTSCPLLTDKDIELISQYKLDIAKIQSGESILGEYLNACESDGKQSGGGLQDKLIEYITIIIVLCITAAGAGASSAFFLTFVPERWQIIILSIANRSPSLPVCMSVTDYAMGMAQSILHPGMSCAYRAQMFEQGIQRIQSAAGIVVGMGALTIKEKIKEYVTKLIVGNKTSAITDRESSPYSMTPSNTKFNPNERGGKRKSGKFRKFRKSRKSRKSRKYKKNKIH